jgi:hypothetical protein
MINSARNQLLVLPKLDSVASPHPLGVAKAYWHQRLFVAEKAAAPRMATTAPHARILAETA